MSRRDHPWLNRIPPAIARFNLTLTKFSQSRERKQILRLFLDRLSERRCLLQPIKAAQLVLALEAVKKIPGDMAEVGSFEGVSAKLLATTDQSRTLYVFDTFERLPSPSERDWVTLA
jgi:hypothetical protein